MKVSEFHLSSYNCERENSSCSNKLEKTLDIPPSLIAAYTHLLFIRHNDDKVRDIRQFKHENKKTNWSNSIQVL